MYWMMLIAWPIREVPRIDRDDPIFPAARMLKELPHRK
jgi:hypothetical protein